MKKKDLMGFATTLGLTAVGGAAISAQHPAQKPPLQHYMNSLTPLGRRIEGNPAQVVPAFIREIRHQIFDATEPLRNDAAVDGQAFTADDLAAVYARKNSPRIRAQIDKFIEKSLVAVANPHSPECAAFMREVWNATELPNDQKHAQMPFDDPSRSSAEREAIAGRTKLVLETLQKRFSNMLQSQIIRR